MTASLDLTGVHEAARRSFAELFGLVGQRDLHDPGDVTRGGLDPDGVRGDQLDEETSAHRQKRVRTPGGESQLISCMEGDEGQM